MIRPSRPSDKGLRFIAQFEGFVPKPYNDPANNATIGYGHLIHLGPVTQKDRLDWGVISREQGRALLLHDTSLASAAIRSLVRPALGRQTRFDALCSLVFNIGTGAFAGSTLLQRINSGYRRLGAEPEWLRWTHDEHGNQLPGLLARRTREVRLWDHGDYGL